MKKTVICVVALLSMMNVASAVFAETPGKEASEQKWRHSFRELLYGGVGKVNVVAVIPPYLWLQQEGGGAIYVCKYNQEKPWEISNKCSQVRELAKDLD